MAVNDSVSWEDVTIREEDIIGSLVDELIRSSLVFYWRLYFDERSI